MNARSLIRQSSVSVLFAAVATLSAYPTSARAQLKVIISGGFSTAYRQVLPEFERSTGITVTTLSGSSQGKGPETIAAQLGRGVPADVAILSREGLTELIAAGRILAATDVDLARAALGVSVRSGTPKPDISTVEAFRQALIGARVVAVPASTSGIYSTTELSRGSESRTRLTPRSCRAARSPPRWSHPATPASSFSRSASSCTCRGSTSSAAFPRSSS